MKKILFYIDHRNRGGAQRVMVELANYFQKNLSYEVVFVTHGTSAPNAYRLDCGVREIVMAEKRIRTFIGKELYRIKELKKICRTEKPDVIISFLIVTNIIALVVGKLVNIPVVISVRNDPMHDHSRFLHSLMRLTYPMARGWVFQTEDAKKYFRKWIKGKAEIIMNPISLDVLEEIQNGKVTGENTGNIVAVGRLDRQKRHDMLIRSYAAVSDRLNDGKLIIYGEGPERKNLQKEIDDLGLGEKVILAGITENVVEKIRGSRLFVLSSDYEGMPNALLEAMAVGLPVISTDCPCGGPAMVVENGINGLLVEVGNEKMLSESMVRLMRDDEFSHRLGKNAEAIRQKCSLDNVANMWKKLIDECSGV